MTAFASAFTAQSALKPRLMKYVAPILYRTLGPTLPAGMEMAAVVWGLCLMYVQRFPEPAKRAGFGGPLPIAANRLFRAMLSSPSGVVYARSNHEESWQAIRGAGNRINLHIPELLSEFEKALCEPPQPDTEFPYILSAGERRSDTANTAVRDTAWHTKGLYGALRVSPQDAAEIGCDSGDTLRLTTRRASADVVVEVSDMMAPGHISLPNGTGIDYTDAEGVMHHRGVAPNEFTDSFSRDFLAGTPWHKHIPARLEKSA
jgi:anaerobic selenocysteine-containing dehydrogenase